MAALEVGQRELDLLPGLQSLGPAVQEQSAFQEQQELLQLWQLPRAVSWADPEDMQLVLCRIATAAVLTQEPE